MSDATYTFLEPIFDTLPDDLDFLLWVLNPDNKADHSSFFVHDLEAAQTIVKEYSSWHVYYGVGLRERQSQQRPRWRGASADVRALLLLHGDVDIAHPEAHKNETLPPDTETARRIIDAVELKPSYLIHSGYGLQPLWALKEPELLVSAEDRFAAHDVAKRLHAALAAAAWRIGKYSVDATHDLSRVLRLPGSRNHKIISSPVPCTIIETGPLYAGLGDFLDVLPPVKDAAPESALEKVKGQIQGLTFSSGNVSPNAFKILDLDPRFTKTWEKRRRDLGDGSQSAYDFSIALQALYGGWSPEDTLALMYEFRKQYRNEHRLAYYLFTLKKAIFAVSRKEEELAVVTAYTSERLAEQAQEEQESGRSADEEDPSQLYAQIESFLGLQEGSVYTQECRVIHIALIVIGSERCYQFTVQTPDGPQLVKFQGEKLLDTMHVFSRFGFVVHHINTQPVRVARPTWIRLLNRLFAIIQEEEYEELAYGTRLQAILVAALRNTSHHSKRESCIQSYDNGHAFVFEGHYYTTFEWLRQIIQKLDPEWKRSDLSAEVRKLDGARQSSKQGTRRRVRYWVIPLTSFDGTLVPEGKEDETKPEQTYH